MVEKNAVTSKYVITFSVIYRHPVRVDFGASIRTAGPEWCCLSLWDFGGGSKHLAARCLVELSLDPHFPYRFQQADRPERGDVTCIFGVLKTYLHMALCTQVINLIRLQSIEELDQARGIGKIGKMQKQPSRTLMPIRKDSVDSRGIET